MGTRWACSCEDQAISGVLNHLATEAVVEVDINIRCGWTFRVKESLEEKVGLDIEKRTRDGLLEIGRKLDLPPLVTNDCHIAAASRASSN